MSFLPIVPPPKFIVDRMVSTTLQQFRRSPVFLSLVEAYGLEIQALTDAIDEVMVQRGADVAEDVNLDGIGHIVGQKRELVGYENIWWFTPDRPSCEPDNAPVWVENAPLAGDYAADDEFFRQLIEAKVIRNHIKFSSVPEIQAFVKQAFNIDVSFVRIDTMTVDILVSDDTSDNLIEFLAREMTTKNVESVYFLPMAAGVKISSIARVGEYYGSMQAGESVAQAGNPYAQAGQ